MNNRVFEILFLKCHVKIVFAKVNNNNLSIIIISIDINNTTVLCNIINTFIQNINTFIQKYKYFIKKLHVNLGKYSKSK